MTDDNQQEDNNIEQIQKDLYLATNNWKRALADFENYKRRKETENKELVEFAKEVTVVKLLPTIDTLEQALRHLPEYNTTPSANADTPPILGGEAPQLSSDKVRSSPPEKEEYPAQQGEVVKNNDFAAKYQNWQTGVNGILMQLDKVLADLGVKKIEAVGKKFDPNYHEAVKEVEGEEDHMVVDELQSGFELNGKVIRPSQVVISKRK